MSPAAVGRQHLAAGFGLAGGILGVLAGLTHPAVGPRIPSWTGAKNSAVALGLVTVLLSLAAVAASRALRGPALAAPRRRGAAAIGLLVPAGVCFSTVGRLWVIPGLLLLVAFVLTLTAGGTAQLRPVLAAYWTHGLLSLLGTYEILMAAAARPAATSTIGVIAGVALIAAPWLTVRKGSGRRSGLLLLIGTVPFAVLTWWSLVSPLLGLVALVLGFTVIRGAHSVEGATRPTPA